ncbi:hypothetical protein MPER_10717, partial [Moniliophthora perniciosa FA553]
RPGVTYEEMPLFTQSMAVFYETLRLFPPGNGVPKVSVEDTTLVTESTVTGETRIIPVPRGTVININIVGLHYNPRYWEDPEEFKPSRFRGEWPRDAFLPFSSGARSCIGRKIELKDEPEFAGETLAQKKARIFAIGSGLTLACQAKAMNMAHMYTILFYSMHDCLKKEVRRSLVGNGNPLACGDPVDVLTVMGNGS